MTVYLDANCVIYLVELNPIWGPKLLTRIAALPHCVMVEAESLSAIWLAESAWHSRFSKVMPRSALTFRPSSAASTSCHSRRWSAREQPRSGLRLSSSLRFQIAYTWPLPSITAVSRF
jgi:hypothetical protein